MGSVVGALLEGYTVSLGTEGMAGGGVCERIR